MSSHRGGCRRTCKLQNLLLRTGDMARAFLFPICCVIETSKGQPMFKLKNSF